VEARIGQPDRPGPEESANAPFSKGLNRLRKKPGFSLFEKEGLAGAKARIFTLLQLRHD
jgi:hypothetical protein